MKDEKHILVVEDDVGVCTAVVDSLKRAGYRSYGCFTSREALLKMKNQTFDCILVDIRLGLESGEELVGIIRERKDAMNLGTPIVVISGYLEKDLVGRLAKQIQGALVKPFEMSALLNQVKALIGPA